MKTLRTALIAGLVALSPAATADDVWIPSRPVDIVVPAPAGSSLDEATRIVATIVENAFGVPVAVANRSEGAEADAIRTALEAPRDGYTWTANAVGATAAALTGRVPGSGPEDYRLYLLVAEVPVLSVAADSPYDGLEAFLAAVRGGERVTVATAGAGSPGGIALAALLEAGDVGADIAAKTYHGGGEAALAAASGEAAAAVANASVQAELIRAGRLHPLAALSGRPLQIDGAAPIPPVTDVVEMRPAPRYSGILVPAGAPEAFYETLDHVWRTQVSGAAALEDYARRRGVLLDPAYGEEATEKAMPAVVADACARAAAGETVIDPSAIGIECPVR